MDKLFQSRSEIEEAMEIIAEWLEHHPNDDKAELAKKLLVRLDFIHMTW